MEQYCIKYFSVVTQSDKNRITNTNNSFKIRQKVLNAKTIICFLILTISASKLVAQENNEGFDEAFIKSFSKNFRIPESMRDPCTGSVVLLAVEPDKSGKIGNFRFSDNASAFLKEGLRNTVGKLDNTVQQQTK